MQITTEMIKQLREATNAGILDCRKALEAANGDFKAAVDFLREKGLATAAKRADRRASEGVVELYSHGNGRVGVMLEVNCETDFVGRSEAFRNFAHELALQIAASSPIYIREEDVPQEVLDHEAQIATAKAREEGKPEAVLPRIVEGALKKFKTESVLLLQPYIRDESITVQQLLNDAVVKTGENIVIRRFTRWALGEASED
ncbi:MAG TPA: translation elongation factor Ts [Anaerolineaceae bacterium]|jgi:elongation factor Ts|nr:translation elongation factor Ts [Longilinea sp.]NMD32245.1 translation elongation factor Ts [Chloroflexota bacterium]HNS64674.1 translation elongation factor Ts [Anaerolineaceae bacterium]HNZ00445.1 translation elongation factor Ts [Anaerolineaceae bacterium]HOD45415.1 translation elongation factor Ts [Anaerolineaceae bacterium]